VSKPFRVVACVGAAVLICALLGLLGRNSGNRGALRAYVAELQAKGERLTYEELARGRRTNFFDSHAVITNVSAQLKGGKLSTAFLKYTNVFVLAFPDSLWHSVSAQQVRLLCLEKAHSP
jgi:hypothetical protein